MIRTVYWEDGALRLIDQTLLPGEYREITIETPEALWDAIKRLRVRGAPAIGIAAAFGVALAAHRYSGDDSGECLRGVLQVCDYLATARPTAANLFWALERMRACAKVSAARPVVEMRDCLLAEAEAILEEDIRLARQLGRLGADLLQDGDVILTH